MEIIILVILSIIIADCLAKKLKRAVVEGGKPAKMYEQYWHHKVLLWVRADLKGRHRDHCLCFDCKLFHPGSKANCPIAQRVYENCVDCNIVTPMWECPQFTQDPFAADRKWNQQ
ncbi:hypothetical protein KAR91_01675 [Candidatus Pacearchaeota archaeon]|nr:hypothetical protein [Candidatus Pacearchaeota archaeon]